MKTYIDKNKLIEQMHLKGYEKYTDLCRDAGINYNTFYGAIKNKMSSLNTAYLLADCLECYIDDIVSVDWEV